MNIYEKLAKIQSELKVNKTQRNDFGGYMYRSAEQIEAEAKPICLKHQATLLLTDDIALLGTYNYVGAVAMLVDWETGEMIQVKAFAREPESKKGMDASQITGTASSYARKYALSGLFCLDDVKDDDTNEVAVGKNVKILAELEKRLAEVKVDRHDQAVIDYVNQHAKTSFETLDMTVIAQSKDCAKVVKVYEQILKQKEKSLVNDQSETY